jgi:hypothetical protein
MRRPAVPAEHLRRVQLGHGCVGVDHRAAIQPGRGAQRNPMPWNRPIGWPKLPAVRCPFGGGLQHPARAVGTTICSQLPAFLAAAR